MPQPPLDYLFGLEQFGIKFGLENIHTLVDALGQPDRAYRIAHIAGTNGKGSVTAMVDAALRAAGHRSGRYTSPHLIDLTERFVIDGSPVATARLERAAAQFRQTVDELLAGGRLRSQPTFFEATTAIALALFRDAGVEIAVCEVGLGGRLDATNVVVPTVTAITSIALDHQQYLGSTLAAIAAEKGGIVKPGVPVVLGALPPEAAAVIVAIAKERSAPIVHVAAHSAAVDAGPTASGGRRLQLRTSRRDYGDIDLALGGAHQVDNALVAVHVLEALDAAGLSVPVESVRAGLATVRWPGRLDLRRLPDGREILFDAAHNPAGAQALAAFLASEAGERRTLVFAAMRDKDVTNMLRALAPRVRGLVLTRALTPRSADPADLAEVARSLGVSCPLSIEPSPAEALETAWRITPRIAVAGSIFLIGDVMKHLGWS